MTEHLCDLPVKGCPLQVKARNALYLTERRRGSGIDPGLLNVEAEATFPFLGEGVDLEKVFAAGDV